MSIYCDYCGRTTGNCVCPDGANYIAGYTASGYPHDRDGNILTHLLTREQKRQIESHHERNRVLGRALTPGFLSRKQAGG